MHLILSFPSSNGVSQRPPWSWKRDLCVPLLQLSPSSLKSYLRCANLVSRVNKPACAVCTARGIQYCSLLLPHGLWNGLPVLCRFLVLQTSCSFLLVRMGLTFFSLGYSLNAIPLYLQRLMLLQLQTQCKLFLQKCPRCSRERPGL